MTCDENRNDGDAGAGARVLVQLELCMTIIGGKHGI